VNVFIADEQDDPLDSLPLMRLAERVLETEGMPADTEVAIVLVGADEIADYNQRFLGRSGPTDVLSFPLEELEPGRAVPGRAGGPPLVLGDIFICPQVVREQAAGAGAAFEDEMGHIVVHGLLHLLGYDHDSDGAATLMAGRERQLLGRNGPGPA
jgi:probable rRNA maturation factor